MKKTLIKVLICVFSIAMLAFGFAGCTAMTEAKADSSSAKTIYFKNNYQWDTVKCYYWGGSSTNWPGEDMQKVGTDGGYDVYKIVVSANNVIFNAGSSSCQTVDIAVNGDTAFYIASNENGKYTVATFDYVEEDEVTPVETKTVYFNNSYAWDTVKCYFWNSNTNLTQWPGEDMTYINDYYYSIEVPADANVIFNNGNGIQTADLTDTKDGCSYQLSVEGNGTPCIEREFNEKDIYLYRPDEFITFFNNPMLDANVKVISDAGLGGATIKAIGSMAKPFTGTFDGNNKTISNFTIEGNNFNNWGEAYRGGFFGIIGANSGTIKNVNVLYAKIDIDDNENWSRYGIICGYNSGTITNCSATQCSINVTAEYDYTYVGGLVGQSHINSTIAHSSADTKITVNVTKGGSTYVGGIVASTNGSVTTTSFTGTITTDTTDTILYVGGIAGQSNAYLGSNDVDTTFFMDVTSNGGQYRNYIGGIVGSQYYSSSNLASYNLVENYAETIMNIDLFLTGTSSYYAAAYIGGIAGYSKANIRNAGVTTSMDIDMCNLYANVFVGGAAGYTNGDVCSVGASTIIDIYNYSNSTFTYVGGLAGYLSGATTYSYTTDKTYLFFYDGRANDGGSTQIGLCAGAWAEGCSYTRGINGLSGTGLYNSTISNAVGVEKTISAY